MNAIGFAFLGVAVAMILALPRQRAILPLLLSTAYMTPGQTLEIGPANFSVTRLLVVAGLLRVLMRREGPAGGVQALDRLLLAWAAVLVGTSLFHTSDAWIFRLGIVWTELGCYFLFRSLLQDLDSVRYTCKAACVVFAPVAVLMLIEKATGANAFSALGGVHEIAAFRDGQFRASGPFAHPILAGTAGAAVLALALGVWRSARAHALLGVFSGAGMVLACTSSGPVLMVAFVLLGLASWKVRGHMRLVRGLVVVGIALLAAVMNDPFYFVMARIDITGGSQGYFRAQLIRSAIDHLPEWWFAGTDYTRHWMSSGIYANDRHTDITNHILQMGVWGGLPLMTIFVAILVAAFGAVGRAMARTATAAPEARPLVWSLGALLFGFLMTFFSISLFDQSVLYFYLTLAAIATASVEAAAAAQAQPTPAGHPLPQCGAA